MSDEKTWLEEIIEAYRELGGSAHYSDIYDYIDKTTSRSLTNSWKATIRRVIETHSSDSDNFAAIKDIFYSVDGIGKGVWGLREDVDKETPKASDIDFSDAIDKTRPDRTKTEIYRIIRDTNLTKKIKLYYNNSCQICGKTLKVGDHNYSEAHHIQPLGNGHDGLDLSENIIVLCPNHHVEFDYGSIAINPVNDEVIHIDLKNEFIGKKVFKKHDLGKEYLQYNFDNIYGHL